MPTAILTVVVSLLLIAQSIAGSVQDYARIIAPLIDRTKLSTLKERGANPRVQKYVYWLALADRERVSAEKVIDEALKEAGYSGEAAKLTKAAMLRNLHIATRLGTVGEEGMSEMRKGNAATIRNGPYKGERSTQAALPARTQTACAPLATPSPLARGAGGLRSAAQWSVPLSGSGPRATP